MEIVLLRHGRPKIDKDRRLSAAEFGLWVLEYNAASIDIDFKPPANAIEQASRCAFIVGSDLPRSLDSAKALGVENIGACQSIFRELAVPYAGWRFPRFSPTVWTVLFRFMWIFRYSTNAESFKEAKERARCCAARLASLASEHGTVLFVGHGSLNWFISRYLKKMGWSGPKKSPRNYWEFAVYRYSGT